MSDIAASLFRALAERAGRAYTVGPDLGDALQAFRSLGIRKFRGTLCYWNGHLDTPREIANRYAMSIDAVGAERLDCRVAMKAPPLQFSRDLFRDLLESAHRQGVGIQFDSLAPEAADPTFALIRELTPIHDMVGCTLPGRWRRSMADADRAVDLGLGVRVVKGQWADAPEPGIDPRVGFLAIIDRLAGRARHVAVATHDPALAHEALARLRAAHTPCELELLVGLPVRDAIDVAKAEGVPVRIYLPYGHGSPPYAMRHATRNPRIAWWILRDLCRPTRSMRPNRVLATRAMSVSGT